MTGKDKNVDAKLNYYAEKIHELGNLMKDEARFLQWSIYELNERSEVLKANYARHEQKCMAKKAENKMNAEESKQFYDETREIDDLYIALRSKIQMRIDFIKENPNEAQTQKQEAQHSSEKESEKKNPMHAIKPFSGSLNDWFEFHDEIDKWVVKNDKLSDEEKMISFVQVCPPEILNTLRADGFQDAWGKMLDNFDNKYKLGQFYARKLDNMVNIEVPSSESLSKLLVEFEIIKKAFARIGTADDARMMFSMVNKLDQNTARAWNRHRRALAESWAQAERIKSREHMPSLDALIDFVKDEQKIYFDEMIEAQSFGKVCTPMNHEWTESSGPVQAHTGAVSKSRQVNQAPMNMQASSSNEAMTGRTECVLCEKSFHPLFRCTKFLGMQLVDRIAIISKHRLCMKCFRPDHVGGCTDQQSNKPCERCKPKIAYHNSTICEKNTFTVQPTKRPTPKANRSNAQNYDDDWTD